MLPRNRALWWIVAVGAVVAPVALAKRPPAPSKEPDESAKWEKRFAELVRAEGPHQNILEYGLDRRPQLSTWVVGSLVDLAKRTEKDKTQLHMHLAVVRHLGNLRATKAVPYLVQRIDFEAPGATAKGLHERFPHAAALVRIGADAVPEIMLHLKRDRPGEVGRQDIELYAYVMSVCLESIGGADLALVLVNENLKGTRHFDQLTAKLTALARTQTL
jgi:hypothetical protein